MKHRQGEEVIFIQIEENAVSFLSEQDAGAIIIALDIDVYRNETLAPTSL